MTSEAESELGALLITAKEMVPMRQTLSEMGWPQPPSPLQTNNSTAECVVNNTIILLKIKSMDLRFHWVRCHKAQS